MSALKLLYVNVGRPKIEKRFLQSGRSGFYLGVLEEGRITAGDSVEWLTRQPDGAIAPPIAVGGKGKYPVASATKMNGNTQSAEEFPFCSRS